MRPAFRIEAEGDSETLATILKERLEAERGYIEGTVARGQCALLIPQSEQRFWTPCLDLMFEDESAKPQNTSRVKIWGTFSPRPEIWTAFMFAMGVLIILSIFSGIYGVAQLALGRPPLALVIPLVAAFGAAFVYIAALVGQGLSITDMYRLRAFFDDCLRELESRSART
ncbi:MAG: hypothetical protein AB8G23_01425 [Myxococcota bacterium]